MLRPPPPPPSTPHGDSPLLWIRPIWKHILNIGSFCVIVILLYLNVYIFCSKILFLFYFYSVREKPLKSPGWSRRVRDKRLHLQRKSRSFIEDGKSKNRTLYSNTPCMQNHVTLVFFV